MTEANVRTSANHVNTSECHLEVSSQNQISARWSAVLSEQHRQLEKEISDLNQKLSQPQCQILLLDTHLKKLIKAVVLHLELEAFFLAPSLSNGQLPLLRSQQLSQGYLALRHTCDAILNDLHALKLSTGNGGRINREQMQPIRIFLNSIHQRLTEEDQIYSEISQNNSESAYRAGEKNDSL